MSKPKTLHDLLIREHIGLNEINTIARSIFTSSVTMAGPEGYLITGVNFDDLPDHVQGFVRKAILQFTVKNILDANEPFIIDSNGEAECVEENKNDDKDNSTDAD